MTITLSKEAYWELFEETAAEQAHIDDDITQKYPAQLGQGYYRTIQLRDGLELAIANYQLHDDIIVEMPERSHPIEYTFLLSGVEKHHNQLISAGQYSLFSSGIAPKEKPKSSATQPIFAINVHIEPELFTAFWHSESESTLPAIQQLLRGSDEEYYLYSGRTTIAMQTAVQQILQCPYQSLTKRMYLESKVWELMALLIQNLEQPSGNSADVPLKLDDIDRIHYAKEILLRQLDNPLSLMELARQVGLNDCTLKRGFRQVFGKTAFGYLHDYRLEQARQLLEQRRMNVSEIARSVGFANRSYFASAFRKKYGVNPRDYLNQKNSA